MAAKTCLWDSPLGVLGAVRQLPEAWDHGRDLERDNVRICARRLYTGAFAGFARSDDVSFEYEHGHGNDLISFRLVQPYRTTTVGVISSGGCFVFIE